MTEVFKVTYDVDDHKNDHKNNKDKYENLIREGKKADDSFVDYCDKYEIVIIPKDEQRWWLNFNIDSVIVQNPESSLSPWHEFEFIAIPKAFAEKCLILGYAPD
jgi:hypothetical protein